MTQPSRRDFLRFMGSAALVSTGGLAVACGGSSGSGDQGGESGGGGTNVLMGFSVKTLSNPYWVTMEDAAQKAAKKQGVELVTGAGEYDGDNASQVTFVENMITRGADAIAITPNLSSGIVPVVKRAKEQGITVIAVDTTMDPQSAADATISTDNFKASVLKRLV